VSSFASMTASDVAFSVTCSSVMVVEDIPTSRELCHQGVKNAARK
jgi:hypothetical protein